MKFMLIVMKSAGDLCRVAEVSVSRAVAVDTANQGPPVVVVTSAMSKVNRFVDRAARQASRRWDSESGRSSSIATTSSADALVGTDPPRHADVLDALQKRLDRFEKPASVCQWFMS